MKYLIDREIAGQRADVRKEVPMKAPWNRQVGRGRIMPILIALIIVALMVFGACAEQPKEETIAPTTKDTIELPTRTFTPQAGIPEDFGERAQSTIAKVPTPMPESKRAHILAQLTAPPDATDRKRWSEQGLTLLAPVNKRVWHAAITSRGVEQLASIKAVRWADLIQPADKLAPSIEKGAAPFDYQTRPEGRIAYSVLFHKDVTAEEVEVLAKQMDIRLEEFSAKTFGVVRTVTVNVPAGGLAELAAADIVAWIEPVPPPDEDHNRLNAQLLSNVDTAQLHPFDLDGTGVAVGVWEANDTVYAGHLDFTPRVIVEAGQTADNDDHAAHVAGTVGASGVNVVNAEGMAPNVTIASYDHINDTAEMAAAATSPGNPGDPTPIRISNHSYGPSNIGWNGAGSFFNNNQNLFGQYDNRAQAFDNVVFQTSLIISKSAGNDRDDAWDGVTAIPGVPPNPIPPRDCTQGGLGVDADCIGSPATAKNVITVGAMGGGISDFSAFGPTDDGRIKPDLMAQGENMRSLACNCFDDRNGDGLDDVPNSTTANRLLRGTSMSTPVVTGVAALVLQEANTRNITMTPAAMKALLIQTALDVQGVGQAQRGPDYATGWGIVDAEAAVNLLRQNGLLRGELKKTGMAGAWTRTFYVPVGEAEIKLTLAWDDPAGNPAAPQNQSKLVNDLDLRLIAPNLTQFNPWTLNPANPGTAAVRNGGNDAVNNVEQVSVLNPMAGVWTVQVTTDAGNLPQVPQRFAVAGVLPRSDVVLVMDRSNSMSLNSGTPGVTKLAALQSAANEFVDLLDLDGGTKLGLVQFKETLVPFVPPFDLQPLSTGNLGAAHTAIGSLVASGWTNIIAGVNEANSQLSSDPTPFPRQAVVVFSDGKHNRPIGSNLNDISTTVQAGSYRFYSIGFGTDVDDAILTNVANASGGIHLNEQDLSPIQLTKYFLTVGALVHDMSVLSDPTFEVADGQPATVSVNMSELDQTVTFAVNWTGVHAKDMQLELLPPDKHCSIEVKDQKGLQIRKGKNYRLIRVELPYRCDGLLQHKGNWTLVARPKEMSGDVREIVDIMVISDSRLKLNARAGLGEKKRRFIIAADFIQDGKPLRKDNSAIIEAHILLPFPSSGDSEKQDRAKKGEQPPKIDPQVRKQRLKTVKLYDSGKEGDVKAGDGIFTSVLDVGDLKPGLVQARIVGTLKAGGYILTREATVSTYLEK